MNEDVTRISSFGLNIVVEEMLEAKDLTTLEELYEEAEDALDAVYNSVKAKIEY